VRGERALAAHGLVVGVAVCGLRGQVVDFPGERGVEGDVEGGGV
jgi:hypothetical protein